MKDREQAASAAIIGGADGPTSIFMTGKGGKKPLKLRLRDCLHKQKRGRAEKKITAGGHTLEEVAAYAQRNYGAAEANKDQNACSEQRNALKESLLLRHKPELLGIADEAAMIAFFRQPDRSKRIEEIPDSEMPMDFHIYEITIGDDRLEMEIDYVWNVFSVSCSGSKKAMKQFKKILRELYVYYGVSEKDIAEKTERYLCLLSVLSS